MSKIILKTSRFLLKSPVEEDDFDQITKIKSDPLVSNTQLYGKVESRELCRFMFQHYITDARITKTRRKRWVFGIYPLEVSSTFPSICYIGNVGLSKKNVKSDTANLFFEIGPLYWGMGIATECVGRVIEFGSENNIQNFIIDPIIGNEASKKVALKLGFEDSGTFVTAYNGLQQHIYKLSKQMRTG